MFFFMKWKKNNKVLNLLKCKLSTTIKTLAKEYLVFFITVLFITISFFYLIKYLELHKITHPLKCTI